MEFLSTIMSWLIPPTDAEPGKQYGWRIRVALVACVSFLGVCFITAIAYGLVPGIDGFARVGEVSKIVAEVRSNRAESIGNELFNLRIKQCTAPSGETKQLYEQQIIVLELKYQELTGHKYPLPVCTDL